ncbi:MAG: histone deacetylase family protein [Deltaproteobacteria bacterium]|nr:histone deacetylase family protein [Deltaproteobacteria bacterium]
METKLPRVVYHPLYMENYRTASVERPARLRPILDELVAYQPFVTPVAATDEDILLVHSPSLVEDVKRDKLLYQVAAMAVGGALTAADLALAGEPAFGLLRPPGHHAGPSNHWGFCFFNNVAIAVEKLIRIGRINRAFILDIDLHFGDGTDNFFQGREDVTVFNVEARERQEYLDEVTRGLSGIQATDLVAVSAGFDTYAKDWGGILDIEDYATVARLVKEAADTHCSGHRFALLEGGYYLEDLGKNVVSFLRGFA